MNALVLAARALRFVSQPFMHTIAAPVSVRVNRNAQHYYGDGNRCSAIFESNKPMLSDPDMICPGQSLRIPRRS